MDFIVAQKLPMLKQGIKSIKNEFIWTHALSQLSFIQFKPYAILFLGFFLSLKLMPKRKKTLETSLDLVLSFKTSTDTRVEGPVLNVNYLENWCHNFIQKKHGRKRHQLDTCILFFRL